MVQYYPTVVPKKKKLEIWAKIDYSAHNANYLPPSIFKILMELKKNAILGQRIVSYVCPAVLIHLEIFFGDPIK